MDEFVTGFAGFGLLFIGLRIVGAETQLLAGGRLREIIARSLDRRLAPPVLGMVSGMLTQSAGAVTFAAAGLVSAGAASLRQALSLLVWTSVGTSILVLAVAVDLRLLAFLLFGAVGLALLLRADRSHFLKHALFALIGLALLLFGVTLLKTGMSALKGDPSVVNAMSYCGQHFAAGLLVGVISGMVLQSAQIATVLALPLVQVGLLGIEGVSPMIYGASFGTGLGRILVASAMDLATQRLTIAGALARAGGTALLITLFLIEIWAGVPLLVAAAKVMTESVALQAGLVYLASQFTIAVVGEAAGGGICRLTDLLARVPTEETPAAMRPAFLVKESAGDAPTAAALASLELTRLAAFLPQYLDDLRDPVERAPDNLPLLRRHEGSTRIATAIDAFLAAALRENPGDGTLLRLRIRLPNLRALQGALHAFAADVAALPLETRPARLDGMVEGLHAVLCVAADALATGSGPAEQEILRTVSAERGPLMESVRASLLAGAAGDGAAALLLDATLHFEKCLWLLHRMSDE